MIVDTVIFPKSKVTYEDLTLSIWWNTTLFPKNKNLSDLEQLIKFIFNLFF